MNLEDRILLVFFFTVIILASAFSYNKYFIQKDIYFETTTMEEFLVNLEEE